MGPLHGLSPTISGDMSLKSGWVCSLQSAGMGVGLVDLGWAATYVGLLPVLVNANLCVFRQFF